MITRHDVDNAKNLVRERLGAPYRYGEMFDPHNPRQGTDCSGVWNDVLATALGRLIWGREAEGNTTEAYRYVKVGERGPFGTIRVARPQDIPADAVAKLAFHHEGNGGAASHMWGELDGMRIESASGKGLVTGDRAWPIDHSYATAWAYLPGPISAGASGADVLARATGLSQRRAAELLDAVADGLRASGCTNVKRIAMWLAQVGHESAGFNATEEYASGAAYEGRTNLGNTQPGDGVRFKGRTWIQITGRNNYAAFSRWANANGHVPSPSYFVDRPTELAALRWAGIGAAWYWTVARSDINALCDAGDLLTVTRRINGGLNGLEDAPNGAPGRRTRYNRALNLGDQLLEIITTGDDFMPALSADEQREMLDLLRWMAAPETGELRKRFPSRSPLRHLGEGLVDTAVGVGLNDDANDHVVLVKELAQVGDPGALALLREVAGADPVRYPDRQQDRQLASRILASLTPKEQTPANGTAGSAKCALSGDNCVLVAEAGK